MTPLIQHLRHFLFYCGTCCASHHHNIYLGTVLLRLFFCGYYYNAILPSWTIDSSGRNIFKNSNWFKYRLLGLNIRVRVWFLSIDIHHNAAKAHYLRKRSIATYLYRRFTLRWRPDHCTLNPRSLAIIFWSMVTPVRCGQVIINGGYWSCQKSRFCKNHNLQQQPDLKWRLEQAGYLQHLFHHLRSLFFCVADRRKNKRSAFSS